MVIFFNVEEAREQLLRERIVYTGRPKRRATGLTTARHGGLYKFVRLGRVYVTFIKRVYSPEELQPYVDQSGFSSVDAWIAKMKGGLPTYLFRVEKVGNPDGFLQPEFVPGPKSRCLSKLKEGILPEKITLRFTDRVIQISIQPAAATVFTRIDTIDWKGELHHFSSRWDNLSRQTLQTIIETVEMADKVECKFPEEKHWLFKDLPAKKRELPLRATLEPWVEAARVKTMNEFTKEEVEGGEEEESDLLKTPMIGLRGGVPIPVEEPVRGVDEPYWKREKPSCMWCHEETEYENTGLNLSKQICDYYRCKRCFRITSICGGSKEEAEAWEKRKSSGLFQRSRWIEPVLEYINEQQEITYMVRTEDVIREMQSRGVDERETANAIAQLRREGVLFSPRSGYLRRT